MNPLSLLSLLGSKGGRWVLGGLTGALLLVAGWAYVSHLQHTNDTLRSQVQTEMVRRQAAEKATIALGDEMQAERSRAATSSSIKKEIHASPSGVVPPDIRAALERLRHD